MRIFYIFTNNISILDAYIKLFKLWLKGGKSVGGHVENIRKLRNFAAFMVYYKDKVIARPFIPSPHFSGSFHLRSPTVFYGLDEERKGVDLE